MDNYLEVEKFIMDELKTEGKVVLATCNNNQVSARTISVIVHNNKMYFQTDKHMEKSKDIEVNDNVAVCFGAIQIKGTCKCIGKPMQLEWFIDKYKKRYPHAFELYSNLEDERVFEINPIKAKIWTYIEGNPYIKEIDFEKKKYISNSYLNRGENHGL